MLLSSERNIVHVIKEAGGLLRARDAVERGFSYEALRRAVRRGEIVQAQRGYYTLPDYFEDDMFLLQARYSRGIFSYATALHLNDLSDRIPIVYDMTFPARYNPHRIEESLVRVRFDRVDLYGVSAVKLESSFGNEVITYSAERTLCDILRKNAKVDSDLVADAYKRWAKRPSKDIFAISRYAKLLGVEDKVQSYLEVLL